jgi:septal ring factor EnvC (AmiA/AmiB activator)
MVKPILVLSLLLALPPATGRIKPPSVEELQEMKSCVKNLEDMVAEHEERLRIHKAENDALRKEVSVLEARLAALEKGSK